MSANTMQNVFIVVFQITVSLVQDRFAASTSFEIYGLLKTIVPESFENMAVIKEPGGRCF